MRYKTIKIGQPDPYMGNFFVWSCPCGQYNHGSRMVDNDNKGCIRCGIAPDRKELDDFYSKGEIYQSEVKIYDSK